MNIEEAKEAIKEYQNGTGWVPSEFAINILNQLDQPKPVVPQMIFDVIESFDENKDYLHQHMSRQPSEVREWLTHNERDFYEAWLAYPNITVEKEKLYTVEIPNPKVCEDGFLTRLERKDNAIQLSIRRKNTVNTEMFKLTEQEIRKDFDWCWQFAEEVTE